MRTTSSCSISRAASRAAECCFRSSSRRTAGTTRRRGCSGSAARRCSRVTSCTCSVSTTSPPPWGPRSFRALPHRLEPVREVGGVLWINDSKATNIAATTVAVLAMQRPFVLLLGGRHKGEPYTSLAPLLADRCRLVIAYGEAGPLVEQDLQGKVPLERGTTFEDVDRK